MTTTAILWATMLLYCVYFAGHLYDLIANVPNWRSGEVDDVRRYRDFYQRSDPKYFFAPLVVALPLVSLIGLVLIWSQGTSLRIISGLAFAIALGVSVWTVRYFVPINNYIWAGEYDAATLKRYVTGWVRGEYVRIVMIGIGLICAIVAVQMSQGN